MPIADPSERQRAVLLEMLLIGTLITIAVAIVSNLLMFGADMLTPYSLLPNVVVVLFNASALVVLRRGYFRWSVAIVTGSVLLGLAYSLLTTGFHANEDALIVFVIPITLAGLLLTRRSLMLTTGLSMAIVLGIDVWEHVEAAWLGRTLASTTVIDVVVLRFVLVMGLLAFLLERFGRMRAEALALQVAERTRQLEQANHQLLRLSYLDQLTGIANRRQFDTTLEWEWRRADRTASPLSLILIDIDFFKRFNDAYGHQRGDRCLQDVAQTLRHTVQRTSDVVARYGGEEFAVILPGSDVASAVALAEKLRESVRARAIPHAHSSIAPVVTISLGIATITPTAQDTSGDLIALADQALYDAKHAGRDRYALALPKGLPALEPVAERYARITDDDP